MAERPADLPSSIGDIVRSYLGTVGAQQKGKRQEVTIEDEESRVIAALAKRGDLFEVSSPTRVAKVYANISLLQGTSMDLTTGWNFDLGSHRRKAVEEIRTNKPIVVIGSPPCIVFHSCKR